MEVEVKITSLHYLSLNHKSNIKLQIKSLIIPQEEQTVGDISYTDYTRNNFDCGRFKLLEDLDEDVETKSEGAGGEKIRCGATRINDR